MSLVSVVIPTRDRVERLRRAVDSVLQQSHRELELIVVVGAPDRESADAIRSVDDSRVRLVETPYPMTAAGARNAGACQGNGEWLAFLDDDDEWLPNKLERQLALAGGCRTTLVTCFSQVVTPTGRYVRPRSAYDGSVPISEYLFDRRSLFGGSSFMQTSSYLLPRNLFDEIRFDEGSPHDDWGFLLHLGSLPDVRIATVPEVLVVIHFGDHPSLTTTSASWLASLRYLDEVQPLMTRRAYSGYCLGVVGERAARERAYMAFPKLLRMAFRDGSPRIWHVLPYLVYWALPRGFLQHVRSYARPW